MSGWETVLAVDAGRWPCECYRANFPGVPVECADVATIIDDLPAADVLIGGPPCQPYSRGGPRRGQGDDRDGLRDFVAAVNCLRPRQFLMENVPGLLEAQHARYFQETFAGMGAAGHVVEVRELDAVHYGVPQFRRRLFFWGIRSDLYAAGVRHCWPKPSHVWPPAGPELFPGVALPSAVTVLQALGTRAVVCYSDYPAVAYAWSDAMRLKHPPADPDKPAPAVLAKWHKGGAEGLLSLGGEYVRRLTPDECLRLMSAPDDYCWPEGCPKTARYRIAGNGWASLLAWRLSRALRAADPGGRTVIDLYSGGGLGACGWHGRYWSAGGSDHV